MSKTRLGGALLVMLAFWVCSYIVAGGGPADFGPPLAVLVVATVSFVASYSLWPKVTFHIDHYRDRGYTIRPSWHRVRQAIEVTVIVALINLLFDWLGGSAVDWADMRFALLSGAFLYFVYLPPPTDDSAGRKPGAPNGPLPTVR